MKKHYLDLFLSHHGEVFFIISISGASVSGCFGNHTNLSSVVHKYKVKKEDGSEVKHHFLNVFWK